MTEGQVKFSIASTFQSGAIIAAIFYESQFFMSLNFSDFYSKQGHRGHRKIILKKPCFELYVLLHVVEFLCVLTTASVSADRVISEPFPVGKGE